MGVHVDIEGRLYLNKKLVFNNNYEKFRNKVKTFWYENLIDVRTGLPKTIELSEEDNDYLWGWEPSLDGTYFSCSSGKRSGFNEEPLQVLINKILRPNGFIYFIATCY